MADRPKKKDAIKRRTVAQAPPMQAADLEAADASAARSLEPAPSSLPPDSDPNVEDATSIEASAEPGVEARKEASDDRALLLSDPLPYHQQMAPADNVEAAVEVTSGEPDATQVMAGNIDSLPGTAYVVAGNIDAITDNNLSGWMRMRAQPSHRCIVLLEADGRVVAKTVASSFREDLLAAGIGDGCYGFEFEMPRALLNGETHNISVKEAVTNTVLNQPMTWRSEAGTAPPSLTRVAERSPELVYSRSAPAPKPAKGHPFEPALFPRLKSAIPIPDRNRTARQSTAHASMRLLFDVSDLVYYIGHHPNLTGIQRVQSSIVLAMYMGELAPQSSVIFLCFNTRTRRWMSIPGPFLISLLLDLFSPEPDRLVQFRAEDARFGVLPNAREFAPGGLDDGTPSVVCLLGAAWVQQDYFHRILTFKRRYGARFVMMVHDLIPIVARETCDQGTVMVYEDFLKRALRHVDHYLCVSENTAKDLRQHCRALLLPDPPITVTRNGSSFSEFLPKIPADGMDRVELPDRFVLFVSTIEGRKNHKLILDIWRRMLDNGDEPPQLVCVGRIGWRSETFVSRLVESSYLDGRVMLLQEVSDAHLQLLYERCLFTVFPSFYEGWGLPVSESLAAGKICVCSNRSSIPEVAGRVGAYINIDDFEESYKVIRELITSDVTRKKLETEIRRTYKPITWNQVAKQVLDGCKAAIAKDWKDPYPYQIIPYAAEISFGRQEREAVASAIGPELLSRIVGTRRGHFLSNPLREQNFLYGEDARVGGEWAEPEPWGTWLCRGNGELVFGLGPNDSSLYYVYFRVRAAGPVAGNRVTFVCNGEVLWEGIIGTRPKDIQLTVGKRATAVKANWALRLFIQTELSPEQRTQLEAVDGRLPLIGFERFVVVPEDNLQARVDIVTRLVMSLQRE
jgi:glycosyltransferase involved in cell wall biosynthesis